MYQYIKAKNVKNVKKHSFIKEQICLNEIFKNYSFVTFVMVEVLMSVF
jgi:hypothetical protein